MRFLSAAAVTVWLALAVVQALPHVDDCNFCKKCHTGKKSADRRRLAEAVTTALEKHLNQGRLQEAEVTVSAGLGHDGRQLHYGDPSEDMYVPPNFKFQVMPLEAEIKAKRTKQNCTECYGCATQITPLKAVPVSAFGVNMMVEVGASPEWLFLADLPDTAKTGQKAVVKVWCMPIDKVHNTFSYRCMNSYEGSKASQFLLAQQAVMEECGLMDVTIKVWLAPVNAVVPEWGYHVWWDGLWMERAPGISLNQVSYKNSKTYVTDNLQAMLGRKLNKTRVVRAAIYDLLSSQCDRHAQNVFIDETGNIRLIDNLQALKFSWVNCAMDSIFLPGTQKNAIIRWGGSYVFKGRSARPRKSLNPMVLLDYRCYVEGGSIGTNYDPTLRQCLKKLSGMSVTQIQKEYGFPYRLSAQLLKSRATDMINKGFEWALRFGEPRNYDSKRYRPQQPCCSIKLDSHGLIQCGHAWNNTPALPLGDPASGGDWKREWTDSGNYPGGTYVDDPMQ